MLRHHLLVGTDLNIQKYTGSISSEVLAGEKVTLQLLEYGIPERIFLHAVCFFRDIILRVIIFHLILITYPNYCFLIFILLRGILSSVKKFFSNETTFVILISLFSLFLLNHYIQICLSSVALFANRRELLEN